jgi:hypothetical protein
MKLYGLADYRDGAEIVDWYVPRDEANNALAEVLRDEPDWEGVVDVVEVEFEVSEQ